MKKLLIVLPIAAILASCGVNPEKGKKVLESQGYTDVEITGYSWTGCSKDDSFASNFTAKGANGQSVEGSLCSDWFKGITVRFD